MDKGRELIRLAVFGQPVKTSLSPQIHRMFAASCGLEIEYLRKESSREDFSGQLEQFHQGGGLGCNITMPLKRAAFELAAEIMPGVEQAGAANTLVYHPQVGWVAHNTDGAGLVTDLTVNHAITLAGQRLAVLGAGGAAAGVMGPLLEEKPAEVVLVNRNLDRATSLAQRFEGTGKIVVTSWLDLPQHGCFDLVINATSLGHHGAVPPLTSSSFASLFDPGSICYDLNYHKASLPLKMLCGEIGQDYVDGLGMLVEQAALSFDIWTGRQPDSRVAIQNIRNLAI